VFVIRGNPARLSDPAGVQWNVSSTVPDVVSLKVYDASGRLIAEPLRSLPFSGAIVARWDLRDSHGAKVPAGMYFYRGTTAAGVAGGRLVLLH
jgi:flagellar hook assembly protein FlgD